MVDGLTGQGVDADFGHPDVYVLHVAVEAQELPSVRRVLHHLGRQTNVGVLVAPSSLPSAGTGGAKLPAPCPAPRTSAMLMMPTARVL